MKTRNRLLRFWFEKGTDLSGYTKGDLKRIQDKLNRAAPTTPWAWIPPRSGWPP